ncbi:MAG: membrane protein insertion efficiency factor YidD [bacterium]
MVTKILYYPKFYAGYLSIFITILILLFFSSHLKADDNLDFLLRCYDSSAVNLSINDTSQKLYAYNPLSFLGLGLIRFYQNFLSTQDEPVCNFTLSCSAFGVEAIKNRGFFYGILLTADRLTRCNSLTKYEYHIDRYSDRAIDNVPIYYFNK